MASISPSDDPGGGRGDLGFKESETPEGSTSLESKQKGAGSCTSELKKTFEKKAGTENPKVGKNKNATGTQLRKDLNSNTGKTSVRTVKSDRIGSCQNTYDQLADVETPQSSYRKPGSDTLGTEMSEEGFVVIEGNDPTPEAMEKEKHTETSTYMAPEMEKENPTERTSEDDVKKADTDAVSHKQERDDFNQNDSRGKYNSKRNGSHTQSDGGVTGDKDINLNGKKVHTDDVDILSDQMEKLALGQQTSVPTKENNSMEEFSDESGPSTTNRLARVPVVSDNQTDPDTKTECASDKKNIQIEDKRSIPVIIKNSASDNEEKLVKISKDLYMKIQLSLREEGTLERISHKYAQQSRVKMLHEHGKLVLDLPEQDRNIHESKIVAAIKFIEQEMQNTCVITVKVSDYKKFTETDFLKRKKGGNNIYAEHFDKEGLLYICCKKSLEMKVRELVQCQLQQSPNDDSITDEKIKVRYFFSQVLERESVKAHISEAFPNVKVIASKSLENMTVALMKLSGPRSEREKFKEWFENLSENFASCSDVLKVDTNQPEKSLALPNVIQSFFSKKTGIEYIFDKTTCRIWLYSESSPQGDLEKVMKDLLKFISQETEKKPQELGKVKVQQHPVIQKHETEHDDELSSVKEKSENSWCAPQSLLYPEKERESRRDQLKGRRCCENDDNYDTVQQDVVSTKGTEMTSSHDTISESGESNIHNSGLSAASDPGSSHVVSAGREPLYAVRCVMNQWFINKVNGKPQVLDVLGNNLDIDVQENILLVNGKYFLVSEDADGHIHIEDLPSVKKSEASLSPGPSSEVAVLSGRHSDDRDKSCCETDDENDADQPEVVCNKGQKMTSSHDTALESGESDTHNSMISDVSNTGSGHVVSAGKEPLYSVKYVMDQWFIIKVNGKPQVLDMLGNISDIDVQENILQVNGKYYLVSEDADSRILIEDLSCVKKTVASFSPGPVLQVAVSTGHKLDDRGQGIENKDMEVCSDGKKPSEKASAQRQAVDSLDRRSSDGDMQEDPESLDKDVKETFKDTEHTSTLLQHQAEWQLSGEKWKEQTVSNKTIGQSCEMEAENVPEQHEKVLRKRVSFNFTEKFDVTGIVSTIRNECNVSVKEEHLKASSVGKSRSESVIRYTWTFPEKHTLHITHGSWRDFWKDLYVEVLPCSNLTDKTPRILEENSKKKTQMYIPVESTNSKDNHMLCDAVSSVLEEARSKDFMHICIPLDETGSWDKKTFFNEIVKAIVSHFKDKQTVLPVEVELIVENPAGYDFLASQAKQKLDMHTDVVLKEVKEADTQPFGALMVEVVEKPLTQVEADVLVNPTSAKLDLEKGAVSKSLLREAGVEMDTFCKNKYPKGISAWDFAVSPGFGLRSRWVFHAAIEKYQNRNSLKDLQALVSKCLDYASSWSETSIAFPAVGTGCNNFKVSDVSQVMFQAMEEFNSKHPLGTTLKQMKIALLPYDSSLQEFKKKENDNRKKLQKYSSLSTSVLAPAVRISGIDVFGVRGTYQNAVESSDCVVYLWDIGKWNKVRKTHRVLNEAGNQATKDFFNHRDGSHHQKLLKTRSCTANEKTLIHVPCKGEDECLCMAFYQGIMAADECRGKSVAFFIDSDGPFYGYGKNLVKSFLEGVKDTARQLSHIRRINIVMNECSFLEEMQILFQQFKDEHTESCERKQIDKVRLTLSGRECDVRKAETLLGAWLSENGISADIQKGSVLSRKVSDESFGSETESAEKAIEASSTVTRDDILTETDVNRKINRYVLVKNVDSDSAEAVFLRICKEYTGDKLKMVYLCGDKDMLLIFPTKEDAEYLLQNPKLSDLKLEGFRKQALGPFTLPFGKDIVKNHADLKEEFSKLDVMTQTHSPSCLNVETSYQLKCICAMISNRQNVKLMDNTIHDDALTSSKSYVMIAPPINEVSERLWDIFEEEKHEIITKFKTEFGSIIYSQETVHFDIQPGKRNTETEHIIAEVRKFFDGLKCLEFEEFSVQNIKVSIEKAINELDKNSTTYIRKSGKVIVYGKTYEEAKLIKHQSQVKLGIVKPTGRRRPNHIDHTVVNTSSENHQYVAREEKPFYIPSESSFPDTFTTEEGIKIRVSVADITKLENVDCIVNAANETLSHGGGVAAAIAIKAGQDLERDGRRYIKENGNIAVGCNMFTTAGRLPYYYVIHAVGPRWSDYKPHSFDKVRMCEDHLYKTVEGSLKTADSLGMKNVALPAISSAIFGVPEDLCTCQYVKATLDYSKATKGKSFLEEIYFVDINPSIIAKIQAEFSTVLRQKKTSAYNTGKYAKEGRGGGISATRRKSLSESFTAIPSESDFQSSYSYMRRVEMCKDEQGRCVFDLATKSKKRLIVYKADITNIPNVALAMTIDKQGAGGNIMKGVTDQIPNPDLKQVYEKRVSSGIQEKGRKIGQVVVTKTYSTNYVKLIHAIYPREQLKQKEEERRQTLFETYVNILLAALKDTDIRDVALTHFGINAMNPKDVELCAEVFLEALGSFFEKWSKQPSHLETLHFVSMREENVELISSIFQKFFLEKAKMEREKKSEQDKESSTEAGVLGDCAICMDNISDPKQLKCGHLFCTDCIDRYFEVKKVCPSCGYVCGIITGDQPDGNMYVNFSEASLSGFPRCGSIKITYSFPSGRQQDFHTNPGKFYKGITRIAYLPNNEEGQTILRMLRVAFQRKLTFTIGRSRTTDQDGVITWNDIHHKTDLRPNSQFGYPDSTYLKRVKEELEAKGVTEHDIPDDKS